MADPRRSALWWLAAGVVTAVIAGFGAVLGLWFLPFVAGIAAGLAPRWRPRSALGLVLLAVAAGWGAVLWWGALSGAPAGATARVIAALAGLPPHAAVGVAATLAVGLLQVLAAFWLTRAVTKSVAFTPALPLSTEHTSDHRISPASPDHPRNPDPLPSSDRPQNPGSTSPGEP
jgi:hypothetical protein